MRNTLLASSLLSSLVLGSTLLAPQHPAVTPSQIVQRLAARQQHVLQQLEHDVQRTVASAR